MLAAILFLAVSCVLVAIFGNDLPSSDNRPDMLSVVLGAIGATLLFAILA